MIDPRYITKYDRDDQELEEFALFSICVAGKNAKTTAKHLDYVLDHVKTDTELTGNFEAITRYLDRHQIWGLIDTLKANGIGCYYMKAFAIFYLVGVWHTDKQFLRNCSVAQLEAIKGIGSKTARFFIMHSRPKQRMAALDTHILKYLKEAGVANVPKSTPGKGSPAYARLENEFLKIADKLGRDYAEFDLEIWNRFSLDGLNSRGRMKKSK